MVEPIPSTIKTTTIPTYDKREGTDIMQIQQPAGISFAESQFYARTSDSPYHKRHNFDDENMTDVDSSPQVDDTYQDVTNDLDLNKDQVTNEQGIIINFYI